MVKKNVGRVGVRIFGELHFSIIELDVAGGVAQTFGGVDDAEVETALPDSVIIFRILGQKICGTRERSFYGSHQVGNAVLWMARAGKRAL